MIRKLVAYFLRKSFAICLSPNSYWCPGKEIP